MRNFKLSNNISIRESMRRLIILCCTILVTSCGRFPANQFSEYVAPLGEPPAASVLWSPVDQNKILVSAADADFDEAEIYVLDMITKEKKIIALTERGFLSAKTWSPDGEHVIISAFRDTVGFELGGLWKLNIEDNSIEYFRDKPGNIIWGPHEALFTFDRAVEVDSELISEIVRMDSSQGQLETVIFSNRPGYISLGFSLSPDGNQVAFAWGNSEPPMNNFDLYILDVSSGEISQVTYGGDNKYPVWSPNGDLIVYINRVYDGADVVYSFNLTNPTNSCNVKLLEADLLLPPSWSPDGNYLVYIDHSAAGIFLFNVKAFLESNEQAQYCL